MDNAISTKDVVEAALLMRGGRKGERCLLRGLRLLLDGSRAEQDAALLQAQADGAIVLCQLDNRAELTRSDVESALDICGNPRHLLYVC